VGEVLEARSSKEDGITTAFKVRILDSLKGDRSGTIVVRQHGGVIGNETWELEDQPLLAVGSTYLLAVARSKGGEMFLISGPISATKVEGQEGRTALVTQGHDHVRQQRDPGLPRTRT